MANDKNLDLNIDHTDDRDNPEPIARVAVTGVSGFTRDGASPTISLDCASIHALDKEVSRLKGELDDVFVRAQSFFEGREHVSASGSVEADTPVPAHTEKPRVEANLKVDDVMARDVKMLQPNDQLSRTEALMQENQIRHIVVVDDDGKLAGVVSHRDIFYNRLSRSMGHGKFERDKALQSFPVKQVMQTNVTSVDSDTALADAAELMMARKIGCLPVLEGENVVGILTEGDFVAILSG